MSVKGRAFFKIWRLLQDEFALGGEALNSDEAMVVDDFDQSIFCQKPDSADFA